MAAEFEPYTTVDGDMVDAIAFKRFGASSGTAEAIYAANPGLAERGPILPAGVVINIPVPLVKPRVVADRLWD